MFAIEVELLGGRYAATAHNDRSSAEWPPHPARFFSALVAALHDHDPVDLKEREALLWLERQPPPSLNVDSTEAVGRRSVLNVFVPVNDVTLVGDVEKPLREALDAVSLLRGASRSKENDKNLKDAEKDVVKERKRLDEFMAKQQVIDPDPSDVALKTAAALMPDRRTRQVRTFPVVTPERPRFSFIWAEEPVGQVRAALDHLCQRVTRLGHSSSLVRCIIMDRAVIPTIEPNEDGDLVLRTVTAGQLDRLEREFQRHQGVESRVLPSVPRRYGPPAKSAAPARRSLFSDEWIIFERIGPVRPLSSRGTDLTRALRAALIEQHAAETLPASLSGHREDGGAANAPHVAFIALPYVGGEYADGSVQGCAIVMPRTLSTPDQQTLIRLVADWENRTKTDGTVELGSRSGDPVRVQIRRVVVSGKHSLAPGTWCQSARRFVTATPIALDRNPGDLRNSKSAQKASVEAQRIIADACERIDLPRPVSVEVSFAPLLPGAQHANAFLPWPNRPDRPNRVRVHADIQFAERVRGPVLLGAGRYFGLGLCLPIHEERPQ